MEFLTQVDAYKFYNRYALKMGFGTRWSSTTKSRTDKSLVIGRLFVCNKEGKRASLKEGIVDQDVNHTCEIRVGCNAMMKIVLTKSKTWKVTLFVPQHNNHELSTPTKTLKHRSHKKAHRQPLVKNLITQLHRARWVPCYLNDKFLAGTRTSQRSESINSFFDTYVHASTPLHEFVVQYDKALASRRKTEEDEDFNTMYSKPVLTLGWPLEDQAGKCYTRALFTMFKQEMKDGQSYWVDKVHKEGTLTTYVVGRPQTERIKWRSVSYDSNGVVVSCDCKHFESVGLLCRHALCILWKKQVSGIPDRYIMKRWTIDSRYRPVDADLCNNVGASKVDQDLYWGIRYKCTKVLEEAYKSPTFAIEFDSLLTKKLAEIVNFSEEVHVSSDELNSQIDPIAPPISQNSFNLFPKIHIRDPTTSARTKGRLRLPSRIQSIIEESQEKATKKRRTCGFCGEKGHYITGCSKAKEVSMDRGDDF